MRGVVVIDCTMTTSSANPNLGSAAYQCIAMVVVDMRGGNRFDAYTFTFNGIQCELTLTLEMGHVAHFDIAMLAPEQSLPDSDIGALHHAFATARDEYNSQSMLVRAA